MIQRILDSPVLCIPNITSSEHGKIHSRKLKRINHRSGSVFDEIYGDDDDDDDDYDHNR